MLNSDSEIKKFKSAFVALVGRPNSGKSSLLNTLLEENLSIVTPLPQTTRQNIKGIYNTDSMQLVFLDTPGIHNGNHLFNKSMYSMGIQLINDNSIDIICYLIDLSRDFGNEEDMIATEVSKRNSKNVCLIFNKSDTIEDATKLKNNFLRKYPSLEKCKNMIISAISPDSKKTFLDTITPMIPYGPQYFPKDDLTDLDMRFFASEYIRERIIAESRDEVPHATFVEILVYRESKDKHEIEADIHVETQGQKGIIIGKKGSLIRKIQKMAAQKMSILAGVPVSIQCHVRVTPKWRDNKKFLSEMGINK